MEGKIKSVQKITLMIVTSIILVITAVCTGYYILVRNEYQNNIRTLEEENANSYSKQYETILHGYRQLAKYYYDEISSDEKILELISQANQADEKEKPYLRNMLYDLSLKNYERAVNDNFRQYHFVLSDNTSFLRMHKPKRDGDDLSEVRESVRIANEEGRYVEGFEEGRINNGYRFVFPLFYNGESIGCVDIGLSFASISKLMKDLFETSCVFLIKQTLVDEKVWEDLIGLSYTTVSFSSNYYIDNETMEYVNDDFNVFEVKNNKIIVREVNSILNEGNTFSYPISYENKDYGNVFLSIENISGKHAGYLVFTNECAHFYNYKSTFYKHSILLMLTWAIMVLISLILVYNKRKSVKITYYDGLTGALNRNKLYEFIEQEMERDKRYKTNLSIILIDVDEFKNINDTYGHIVGDKVLRNISQIIITNLRKNDILFRYGGDEFLVLLSNTDIDEAKQVAKKIMLLLKHRSWDEIGKRVTISMGVVQYTQDETIEQLIHRSDNMLYNAKQKGRNCVFAEDDTSSGTGA